MGRSATENKQGKYFAMRIKKHGKNGIKHGKRVAPCFLFFAMIRTRPRMTRWARSSVRKAENAILHAKLHAELFLKSCGI